MHDFQEELARRQDEAQTQMVVRQDGLDVRNQIYHQQICNINMVLNINRQEQHSREAGRRNQMDDGESPMAQIEQEKAKQEEEEVNAIEEIQAKLKKLDEVVRYFTNYDEAPDKLQASKFDRRMSDAGGMLK
jgi:hypothetical protein